MKWLIGTILSIVAVIITWLAWQHPKTPAASDSPVPVQTSNGSIDVPPTNASPVAQPNSITSLTDGEQQLVNRLKPDLLTNCKGRSALERGGVVAAVNCQHVETGPTKQPLVVQFSEIESAQTWFHNNTDGFVDQDNCADGYQLGTWTKNHVVAGTIGCSYTTEGDLRIVWVINNALIGVIASGSDGSDMYNWWKQSASVCGC